MRLNDQFIKYRNEISDIGSVMRHLVSDLHSNFAEFRTYCKKVIKLDKIDFVVIPTEQENNIKYVILLYLHALLSPQYCIKQHKRRKFEKELKAITAISHATFNLNIWYYINLLTFANYQPGCLDISRLPSGYGDQIDHSRLASSPISMHLELSKYFHPQSIHSDLLMKVMLAAGDSLYDSLITQNSIEGFARITCRYLNLFSANYIIGILARKSEFHNIWREKQSFLSYLNQLEASDCKSHKLMALEVFYEHHFMPKFLVAKNKIKKEFMLLYIIAKINKGRTSQIPFEKEFIDTFQKEMKAVECNDIMFGGKYKDDQRKWDEFQIKDILKLNRGEFTRDLMFCFAGSHTNFMGKTSASVILDTIVEWGFKIEPYSSVFRRLSFKAVITGNTLLFNQLINWGIDLSQRDRSGATLLMYATSQNIEILHTLLDFAKQYDKFHGTSEKRALFINERDNRVKNDTDKECWPGNSATAGYYMINLQSDAIAFRKMLNSYGIISHHGVQSLEHLRKTPLSYDSTSAFALSCNIHALKSDAQKAASSARKFVTDRAKKAAFTILPFMKQNQKEEETPLVMFPW